MFGAKHNDKEDFQSIKSKARNSEDGKTNPVVWAPCFVHILFGLRNILFFGTPLEEAERWVEWTHVTKDTDMSLAQLHLKFPKLITSLDDLRQRCKLPEEISISSPEQPFSTRRSHVEDKLLEEIPIASPEQLVSTRRSHVEDKLPEEIPIASLKQPVSTKRPRAEDKERGLPSTKRNKKLAQVRTEWEEYKRSSEVKGKAAEETHLHKLAQVQTELEEYKRSSEASIKRLDEEASCLQEALAAKESAVQALENAHQKEISTLKATCRKYKTILDREIGTNADLLA
ncbi:hypothetical protein R1flu_024619 [Riccia fluitans]|uniref:Uncharacterized protein n=1 Tax=Riccia fluitans TaxID=41844 RepID=A0ABD1XVK5_9MARC